MTHEALALRRATDLNPRQVTVLVLGVLGIGALLLFPAYRYVPEGPDGPRAGLEIRWIGSDELVYREPAGTVGEEPTVDSGEHPRIGLGTRPPSRAIVGRYRLVWPVYLVLPVVAWCLLTLGLWRLRTRPAPGPEPGIFD